MSLYNVLYNNMMDDYFSPLINDYVTTFCQTISKPKYKFEVRKRKYSKYMIELSGTQELANVCAMCMCDLEEGQYCYILPKCKHIFHADSDDCIGNGKTVKSWMEENKVCPICRVGT